MSDFLERFEKMAGEPELKRECPLQKYLEANLKGIEQAKLKGYSLKQLAEFISKENGILLNPDALSKKLSRARNTLSPKGCAFAYRLGTEEKTFKKFIREGTSNRVDMACEKIKINTGKSVFIIAEKPMTEKEFKKWKP